VTDTQHPCARGCLTRGIHAPGCPHTLECPDGCPEHCEGCAPRLATLGRLCTGCTTRIRRDLLAIPELCVNVAAREDGQLNAPHPATPTRRSNIAPASPSPGWDTADEALNLLAAWADLITDHQHGTPQITTLGHLTGNLDGTLRGGRHATRLCHWLADHQAWPAQHCPEDWYSDITATTRQLRHLSGTDRGITKIHDLCPACDKRTLQREDGAQSVVCRNNDCGRVWRDAEWLARIQASQLQHDDQESA
jgi:hypothetical protein